MLGISAARRKVRGGGEDGERERVRGSAEMRLCRKKTNQGHQWSETLDSQHTTSMATRQIWQCRKKITNTTAATAPRSALCLVARMLGHGVLVVTLHVVAIRKGLVGVHGHVRHIARGHMRALGQTAALLRCKMAGARLLGTIDLAGLVDAVVAGSRGFGSVEASL